MPLSELKRTPLPVPVSTRDRVTLLAAAGFTRQEVALLDPKTLAAVAEKVVSGLATFILNPPGSAGDYDFRIPGSGDPLEALAAMSPEKKAQLRREAVATFADFCQEVSHG